MHTGIKTCSVHCAIKFLDQRFAMRKKMLLKAHNKARKKENVRRMTKTTLREQDLKKQRKLTQTVFNKMIRLLDKDEPCASCGKEEHEIKDTYFGKWDCGHFKSIGGFPELRFIPLNAYKQCKGCNGGSHYYAHKRATVAQEYEERLIKRIGQDKVNWLNGPHKPAKYTCPELIQMRKEFSAENRRLESGQPPSKDWRINNA